MGYESYNFSLRLKNKNKEKLVMEFKNLKYIFLDEKYDSIYFEKITKNGIIEVEISGQNELIKFISIRTAKVNNYLVIDDIIQDVNILRNNYDCELQLYSWTLKQNIELTSFNELIENFKAIQEDFYKFFPIIEYPVRCNDVLENCRKKKLNNQ